MNLFIFICLFFLLSFIYLKYKEFKTAKYIEKKSKELRHFLDLNHVKVTNFIMSEIEMLERHVTEEKERLLAETKKEPALAIGFFYSPFYGITEYLSEVDEKILDLDSNYNIYTDSFDKIFDTYFNDQIKECFVVSSEAIRLRFKTYLDLKASPNGEFMGSDYLVGIDKEWVGKFESYILKRSYSKLKSNPEYLNNYFKNGILDLDSFKFREDNAFGSNEKYYTSGPFKILRDKKHIKILSIRAHLRKSKSVSSTDDKKQVQLANIERKKRKITFISDRHFQEKGDPILQEIEKIENYKEYKYRKHSGSNKKHEFGEDKVISGKDEITFISDNPSREKGDLVIQEVEKIENYKEYKYRKHSGSNKKHEFGGDKVISGKDEVKQNKITINNGQMKEGFIYILKTPFQTDSMFVDVKVGCTESLASRMGSYRFYWRNHFSFIGIYSGDITDEKEVLNLLSAYQIQGEYFNLPVELVESIEGLSNTSELISSLRGVV